MCPQQFSVETLALMPSWRCDIVCRHCVFSSAPHLRGRLDVDTALAAISELARISSLRRVAVSGGEPFLETEYLITIAKACVPLNIQFRAITNCSFALDESVAEKAIQPLAEIGIETLGVSWDAFHAQFVDPLRVRNVIRAARRLNVPVRLTAVVTRVRGLAEILGQLGDEAYELPITQVKCLPVGRAESKVSDNELLSPSPTDVGRSCRSDFDTVSLTPNGDVFPCCAVGGFTDGIRLGNFPTVTFAEMLKKRDWDSRWVILASQGPQYFVDQLSAYEKQQLQLGYRQHDCVTCNRLFRTSYGSTLANRQADVLKNQVLTILPNTFLSSPHCGLSEFELLNDERSFLALLGEWIFATVLYEKRGPDLGFFTEVLLRNFGRFFTVPTLTRIAGLQLRMAEFIGRCLDAIDWTQYDIIGFSTSFQQTMASLALSKRIKERFPDMKIVFGGANCESEMGDALQRHYPFVDAVSSGESEGSFPELVVRLRTDGQEKLRARPTINTLPILSTRPVARETSSLHMDDLPYLDYSDFLSDRAALPGVESAYRFVPLFETSRGCWWGQKHHCTFCGLNGLSMTYRSKSPERAASELTEIATRFGREILVVDNILDHRYFSSFVESVSAMTPPVLLHYEVKANLNEAQVQSLAAAGIRNIQPGIESLSSRILTLINKGTTLLRNIQLLKLAAESGMFVDWGHLYGVPGETTADYVEIIKMVPRLYHLTPPGSQNRVRADRFSPYFNNQRSSALEFLLWRRTSTYSPSANRSSVRWRTILTLRATASQRRRK